MNIEMTYKYSITALLQMGLKLPSFCSEGKLDLTKSRHRRRLKRMSETGRIFRGIASAVDGCLGLLRERRPASKEAPWVWATIRQERENPRMGGRIKWVRREIEFFSIRMACHLFGGFPGTLRTVSAVPLHQSGRSGPSRTRSILELTKKQMLSAKGARGDEIFVLGRGLRGEKVERPLTRVDAAITQLEPVRLPDGCCSHCRKRIFTISFHSCYTAWARSQSGQGGSSRKRR